MDVQILKTGAVVVGHKGQRWLFEAPENVAEELKSLGITPNAILLTQIAAPGIRDFEGINTVQQIPLRGDGLEAEAIKQTHGWDYVVSANDGAKVLITSRGDVSVDDVLKHDFAIIGNKYRANAFDESVITRPWAAGAYHIAPKVYSKLSEANPAIRGIEPKVTLGQANLIARWADGMERAEDGPENAWAAAIAMFKRTHKVEGERWVRKAEEGEMESEKAVMPLVCPECGYRMESESESPKCPECGNVMVLDRRRQRGRPANQMSRDLTSMVGVKAERGGKYLKTEGGKEFPSSDYLVVEDSEKPSTWHLRITKEPGGEPDRSMMGAAAAALTSPSGHRGNRYEGPGKDTAIRKLRALYSKMDIAKDDWPKGLKAENVNAPIATVITTLKELLPDLPDIEKDSLTIFKNNEERWCWAAITSAAMWDLQDEFVTRKAMDFAVAYATITGEKGPLRHEHIPGLDVGMCERQMRVGDYLFEAGYFFDTDFAQAARKRYQEEPGLYKVSAGLRFKESDLEDGVYRRVVIFERSATKSPAVPITMLGVNDMPLQITEDLLRRVAEDLKRPLDEVKELYERDLKSEKHDSLESLKAALQTSQDEKAIKAAAEKLTDEQRALLVKSLAPDPKKEDDKDKQKQEAEGLKEEVKELREAVAAQTKALATMAKALKGSNVQQESLQDALTELFSALPRSQAAQFAAEKAVTTVDLAAIQKQLNEIGEAVKKNQQPFSFESVYDQFTSPTLNRGVQ